jgi:hypothetical protein
MMIQIEGYPAIPHQGAELDGVGRGCRPNELVARFHFILPLSSSFADGDAVERSRTS